LNNTGTSCGAVLAQPLSRAQVCLPHRLRDAVTRAAPHQRQRRVEGDAMTDRDDDRPERIRHRLARTKQCAPRRTRVTHEQGIVATGVALLG